MTGKQHLFFGLTTAASFGTFMTMTELIPVQFIESTPFICGALLGSLVPDLDTETSTLGKKLPFIPKILNFIFDILDLGKTHNQVYLPNGHILKNHRRYMHDPAIIIPLAIFFTLTNPELFGFFFGYLGHLLLDGLTPMGIPFCYLFNKKMMKPKLFKVSTKSFSATAATVGLSCLFILVLIEYIIVSKVAIF